MQAPGHEEIERIIGSYLYQLIKEKHPNIYNSVCNVCKDEIDFTRLLYLGNWMTDISQVLVPDFFYDIRKKLDSKIENYNSTIDDIAPFIGKKLEGGLNEIFDSTFYNLVSGISPLSVFTKEIFESYLRKIIAQLKENQNKEFSDYIDQYKINKESIKSLIGSNAKPFDYTDTSDPMWDIAQAVVKVFGFRKYCIGSNKMSYENFETAISNFIVSATSIQDIKDAKERLKALRQEGTSTFKLLQYYPSDHLDRPFYANIEDEKVLKPKQAYIDKRLNKGKQERIYDYLLEYRDMLAGKFVSVQQKLVGKYFDGKAIIPNSDVLSLLPKLGTTLHMLEDFYAHSNFYELAILKLEDENLAEPFLKMNELQKIDNETDWNRILNSKRTANSINGTINESNIVTGFFVEEDTKVSLLHILENSIEKYIDKLDIEPLMEKHLLSSKKGKKDIQTIDDKKNIQIVETDSIEALVNFIEGLGTMVDNYYSLDDSKRKIIDAFTPTQINENEFEFFVGNYYKNTNKVLSPEAKQEAIQIINIVLGALFAAKMIKEGLQAIEKYEQLKKLYELLKLIFYIITAERQIVRVISKILFLLLDIVLVLLSLEERKTIYRYLNEKIKNFMLISVDGFIHKLKVDMDINEISTVGGHAILAKDEQVDKKVTYDIVTKMSVFADTFMLDNIFRNYSINNGSINVADLRKSLSFLIHNPCLRGGITNMVYDDNERWNIKYCDFYTSIKLRSTNLRMIYEMYRKGVNKNRFRSEEVICKKFIYENRNLHIPTFEHFRLEMLIQFMDYTIWDLLDKGSQKQILKKESQKKQKPLLSIVFPFQNYAGREPMDSPSKGSTSKMKEIESKVLDDVIIESGLDWSCFFFRKDKLEDIKKQLQESKIKVITLDTTSVLGDSLTMSDFIQNTIGADQANTTLTPTTDERDYYSYFYNVYSQNKSNLISIAEAQEILKKAKITERLAKENYIKFINAYVQKTS